MKVLIVENDPNQLHLYGSYLEGKGVKVKKVTNAQDALKLRWSDFNLILTDIMMAEMDGDEMVKAAIQTGKTLPPIIMFSAVDKSSLEKLGGDGWVKTPPIYFWSKTGTLQELLNKILSCASNENLV